MRTFLFLPLVLLFSCRQPNNNNNKLENEHLDKQILKRIDVISASEKADSIMPALYDINREVGQLILLSKDVENIGASINKSNAYFVTAAKQYDLDSAGFMKLEKSIPLNDVETTIKKNELNLLNQIILRNKIPTPMLTAQ